MPEVHCVYWPEGPPLEVEYYASVEAFMESYQDQMAEKIDEKRSGFIWAMLQLTSPSLQWMLCVTGGFGQVDDPPESPDLAPLDYRPFSQHKRVLLYGNRANTLLTSKGKDYFNLVFKYQPL